MEVFAAASDVLVATTHQDTVDGESLTVPQRPVGDLVERSAVDAEKPIWRRAGRVKSGIEHRARTPVCVGR